MPAEPLELIAPGIREAEEIKASSNDWLLLSCCLTYCAAALENAPPPFDPVLERLGESDLLPLIDLLPPRAAAKEEVGLSRWKEGCLWRTTEAGLGAPLPLTEVSELVGESSVPLTTAPLNPLLILGKDGCSGGDQSAALPLLWIIPGDSADTLG